MKVKRRDVFEAIRWSKDGDHPDVKPGGHRTMINAPCRQCGELQQDHGHIPFEHGAVIVCPGDWVVDDGYLTHTEGDSNECKYNRYTQRAFEELFGPVGDD